jgi:hypothetical protein
MSSQGQKPIDFAPEGLRLALPVDRNCGIRVETQFGWCLDESEGPDVDLQVNHPSSAGLPYLCHHLDVFLLQQNKAS